MKSRRSWRFVLGLAALATLAVIVVAWPTAPGPTGGWMRAAGVEPRYETIGGLRVRYVRKGQGPPVVLMHGLASSLYTWKDVLPSLAEHHDVVAVDLPGFGGSDVPAKTGMHVLAPAVLGLMDRLGIARAALAGNSLGGGLGVALAVHHPERVSHLVLIDAVGFNLAPEDRPWMLRLLGVLPRPVVRAAPVPALVRVGLRQVFHDDGLVTRDRIDEYVVPMQRPDARETVHQLLTEDETFGFPGIVAKVRAPTLVIWGRHDTWIPARDADRFAAAIPGARVALLEAGHMPQEERPADVARLIEDFLR